MDLSILIATRDRAESLRRTLESIALQELGELSWEVIVVDNGSTDETSTVLQNPPDGLPLVALHEPSPGKNRALNRALDRARGELLVFTDDDIVAQPGWLAALHSAGCRWPEDSIFGGRVEPRFPEGTRTWLMSDRFPYRRWTFSTFHPRTDEGPTHEPPLGPNVAFHRRVFDQARFADHMGPTTGEYPMGSEVELLLRLYRQGELFVYVPTAAVEHVLAPHQVEYDYLLRRARRCGRGNALLYPEVGDFPLFGIPLFHLQRLGAALGGFVRTRLADEEARWTADLTLHQVRGQLAERRRVAREGKARRFPSAAAFRRLIRRRGLTGLAATLMRPLLSRIVQWETVQFFEWDLSKSPRPAPAPDGVRAEMFEGIAEARAACAALCRFEMTDPQQIFARLERGDRVAVARQGEDVLGYAWAAYSDQPITELGGVVRAGDEVVIAYDGYVKPSARGQGVLAFLDKAQVEVARTSGRSRQLAYVRANNKASLRSMDRVGKRRCFRATLWRVPLLGWTKRVARGGRWEEYITS